MLNQTHDISDKQFTACVAFFPQNTVPAPFLVQTDTFRNQVPDTSVNHVGHRLATHSHTHTRIHTHRRESLLPFFCARTWLQVRHGLALITRHTYTRACCLFEGKLWATYGHSINKSHPAPPTSRPPDRNVFMLRASHSASVFTVANVLLTAFLFSSNVTKK